MASVASEYAMRADKAARFAAAFFAAGIKAADVAHIAAGDPWWSKLAESISKETGRRLLAPHSQATVDAITRELRYFEEAQAARDRAAASVAFDFRNL